MSAAVHTAGFDLGARYLEVVTATGGESRDIGDHTFGALVADLPLEPISGEFCLTGTPDPVTVEVTIDAVPVDPADVAVNGDCVVLDPIPAPGAVISITWLPAAP